MPPKKFSPKKPATAPSTDVKKETKASNDEVATRYKKVSHVDHILLRPEMYVGSIENHQHTLWRFKSEATPIPLPALLPSGDFEKKLVELKMSTVRLVSSKKKKDGEDDVGGDDAEGLVDDVELLEEEEVRLVNGVDSRLLSSEEPVTCFGPGSQFVDNIFVNPGLLKIVDEIVVNAADNRLVPSDAPQSYIKVAFDSTTGEITVENDGAAIPIVKHPEHGIYVPEMIFGSLLTSSHYGNDPNSIAAGRHGFGAKLTNILSSSFKVECVKDGMRFVGVWSDNMKTKQSVSVKPCSHKGAYTKVSFVPEYSRFTAQDLAKGSESVIAKNFDIIAELGKILKRRLLDLSASIGNSLNVYYNDELLTPHLFADYVRMHLPENEVSRQPFVQSSTSSKGDALSCDYGVLFVPPPPKGSEPAASLSNYHVSLVNGIVTHQGGTHLRFLEKALEEALSIVAAHLEKEERLMLNTALLKQHATLFVNVLVHQSKFDSQSKDRLVSKHSFAPIKTADLVRHILVLPFIRSFCLTSDKMTAALESALATFGKQRNLMRVIPKLVEPADMTIPMHRTLILTEGDSAKALALNSLSATQRNSFGVLPLRGKVLNVRNAHPRRIAANKEIVYILAALGLSTKSKYTDQSQLRYQRVLIMTDQDYDGFHIRGLVISLINYYWPELMKSIPDYVSIFSTPIIKAKLKGATFPFYSVADYKKWRASQPEKVVPLIKIKYYKGLGTSSTLEGREYFDAMDDNVRFIEASDPAADADLMNKTFSNEDDCIRWRKHWVMGSRVVEDMESGRGSLTIPQFVNQQLIQFALADNLRSFPDSRDGLRLSYRKIIWAMFQRKGNESMRVSQCAGYVSEVSNYHHGEASLVSCIVSLAQSHVGSNNVPLLLGEGQFGSRINAGRDSAAPRYIFTNVAPITRKLFPAADDELLEYADQEGTFAEPVAYAPILPTQFLNGSTSIGVGFASRHVPHNVFSVVKTVRAMLDGQSAAEAAVHMEVGVTGFRGVISQDPSEPKRSIISGDFELYATGRDIPLTARKFYSPEDREEFKRLGSVLTTHTLIRIIEIPYATGIEDFRRSLSEKLDSMLITLSDHSGANHVDIRITVDTRALLSKLRVFSRASFLDLLNLNAATSQFMVCNVDGTVQNCGHSYVSQLEQFFSHRLDVYRRRLNLTRERLTAEVYRLDGHIRFTELIKIEGASLLLQSEEDIIKTLEKAGIPQLDGSYKAYLSRSIASLSKDNITSLTERLETTQAALKSSKKDTAELLWQRDLDSFSSEYAASVQGIEKSIAAEYKNTKKNLGQHMDLETFIRCSKYFGFAEKAKAVRYMSIRDREEIQANFEAAQTALDAARKEHLLLKESPTKTSLSLIRSSAAVTNARHVFTQVKKEYDIARKAMKELTRRGGAAVAGGGAGGQSGGSAGGAGMYMLAPSIPATAAHWLVGAAALPAYDALAMGGQLAAARAGGVARGAIRLFGRTLLK